MSTLVHLVYVHGFQGNDTTFQSFPKDLQEYISARIPPNLNIRVQSSLYPTYKSVKPISHATRNFMEWLSTQPEGPVILIGHSMGGLLVADAATDPSNNPPASNGKPRPKRIVGVIAFDTPYLGMHPHVVISGIASLLPKGETESESGPDGEKKLKTEKSMNTHPQINVVDPAVTDQWEDFKAKMHIHPSEASPYYSSSGGSSQMALTSSSSTLSSDRRPQPPPPSLMSRILAHVPASSQDDPIVRWLRKHADDPLAAGKRWVVEHLQFGSCMFDPSDLKDRYARLVEWEKQGGLWVNYWTCTRPKVQVDKEDTKALDDPVDALDSNDHLNPPLSAVSDASSSTIGTINSIDTVSSTSKREPEGGDGGSPPAKKTKKKKKAVKSGHHFVVLPNGVGEYLGGWHRWENVVIAGVNDEVNAHTGLFIQQCNPEYPALVERVSDKILGWCHELAGNPQQN